ncbi:MAG: hypothetical protein GXZ06_10975 [Tissierellia bacterium]|nr:hypothetical protein [Tissierellia bacterium]
MKIFKRLFILGLILVLLTPVFGLGKKENEMDLMVGILENMGATFVESNITLGGVLLDRFIDEEELNQLGNLLKEEMEIGSQLGQQYYNQDIIKEEGLNQLIIQGIDPLGNLVTINISSYEIQDYPGETSLFINLINNEQIHQNNDIILKVEKIFDKYDKMMNVTSCIVGRVEGKVDIAKNEKEFLKLIKELKGKVVEDYKEDSILSISAFTPLIEEYIYTGNKKMNLNIAARYNEEENNTYILIGTPIITVGY